jgi:hypothetical protein
MTDAKMASRYRQSSPLGRALCLTFKVGRSRRPITDGERDLVADAIVEHLQLANWHIKRGQPWGGFAYLGRGPPSGNSEK